MRMLIKVSLLLIGLLNFSSQAQYQVNHLHTDGDTMTFCAVGYGKNAKKASADAEIKVIKELLFYGVPDTQQAVPLISETEKSSYSNNRIFWDSFWSGEYQRFISRSVIARKFQKDENKQKTITLEITVNIRSLRLELERNGIIRKFGL